MSSKNHEAPSCVIFSTLLLLYPPLPQVNSSYNQLKERIMSLCSQSQWPRRQKRGSEADRLLDCGFEFCWRQGSISPVSVVCCHVEVCASGLSFVRRSPTERGVSECDREASIMRRPWPSTGCCAMEIKRNVSVCLFTFYDQAHKHN